MDQTSPPEFAPRRSVSPESIGMKTGALATRLCVFVGLILLLVSSTLSCVDIPVDGGPVATPPLPIENLLLDESAFPHGWTAYAPFEPEDGFGPRIAVTFSSPTSGGGIALHAAYIGRSSEETRDGYDLWATFWFLQREGWGVWSTPDQLRYQSPVAEQLRFACSTERDDGRQVCQAVGQYGRYMTRFHTFMTPETMTLSDFERILVAIDERMAFYLAEEAD